MYKALGFMGVDKSPDALCPDFPSKLMHIKMLDDECVCLHDSIDVLQSQRVESHMLLILPVGTTGIVPYVCSDDVVW